MFALLIEDSTPLKGFPPFQTRVSAIMALIRPPPPFQEGASTDPHALVHVSITGPRKKLSGHIPGDGDSAPLAPSLLTGYSNPKRPAPVRISLRIH